jgi:hypothetical protein
MTVVDELAAYRSWLRTQYTRCPSIVVAVVAACSPSEPKRESGAVPDQWVAAGYRNVIPQQQVYVLPDSIQAIGYSTIRAPIYRPDLLNPGKIEAAVEDINCKTFETRDPGQQQWESNSTQRARWTMVHQICAVADSVGLLIENPLRAGTKFVPPQRSP